jgi:hypothetical protein
MPKDIRNVALSWRQVIAILLIIASLVLLLAATAVYEGQPNEIANLRRNFWIAFSCCAISSVALFFWHHRIVSQPDVYPDILSQLVGANQVFELDTLHFWATGYQFGSQCRVIILLQNVYAAHCTGRLQLIPVGTTTRVQQANLPLEFDLGAAEIIAVWRDFPLPVPPTAELSFGIDGFIRKVRAPRIRNKRFNAIRSQTPTAIVLAGAMVGHIHYSSGSRLNIRLEPVAPDAKIVTESTGWQTLSLWSPEQPLDHTAISQLLKQLLAA